MDSNWQDHIEQRPNVLCGKPVFKGTRLSLDFIVSQIKAGATAEMLLDQYPTLTPEHVRAAMLYAQEV